MVRMDRATLSWMTERQRMRSSRKAVGVYRRWNSTRLQHILCAPGHCALTSEGGGLAWREGAGGSGGGGEGGKEGGGAPDSLWPSSSSLTMRFLRRALRSALMVASMAAETWRACSSRWRRRARSAGDSSAGGLRRSSRGSTGTGMRGTGHIWLFTARY
jgi:hypothetical protein